MPDANIDILASVLWESTPRPWGEFIRSKRSFRPQAKEIIKTLKAQNIQLVKEETDGS